MLERDLVVAGRRLEIATWEPALSTHDEPATPHAEADANSAVGADATIVLLHEGLGSVALWKTFPQRLASRTGCRVIAYSRYGYGKSDVLLERRAPDYMHREGEVVLPELIAALGLRRPILFGHSDGASIALVAAGAHPSLAAALVVEAPHVFVEDRTIASIAAAREAYRTTDLPARLRRYHADVDRTFWGWNDIWLDPAFRVWNIEAYLAPVRIPLLALQGDDDEYGTHAQLDAIARARPDAEIVTFAGCAHSPHREREGDVLEATARFLARR